MTIKYIGSWGDYSGYGDANRNIIYALHAVGVDMVTERLSLVSEQANYGEPYLVAAGLEGKQKDCQIKIIHLTPNIYLRYLEPGKYHIGHLFWETDRIPKLWTWYCNRMDEIWTGSEYTKEALIRSGVRIPIFIFPQPIQTAIPDYKPYKIANFDGFLFYSIFEWIERKNPQALLAAYLEEFKAEENVALLLKTYRNSFSRENRQFIRSAIETAKNGQPAAPRLMLYDALMSEAEVWRLHHTGHCFVSSHRGEGWGRPQMEAMLVGNPVISTNCGGIHEWLDDGLAFLCKWERKAATPDPLSENYLADQVWADVDIADLRQKMRVVFDNQKKAKVVGKKAQKFVRDNFNPEIVGTMMKSRLEEIEKGL